MTLLLLFISYLPSLRGGFIWDDDDYVQNNWTLRSVEGLKAIWIHPTALPQWYPMVHTTYWVEYHLWGLRPLGYKIDNLLLHFANSILLWIILRKLKIPGAWLAAAVFALHPINVETAAWITERKNTLSGFFYLAALLVYFKGVAPSPNIPGEDRSESESGPHPDPLPEYPESGKESRIQTTATRYLVALVLFLAALLSKTVACSLPVAILLILYYQNGKITRRQWAGMIPFFVLGGIFAYITAHLEAAHVGASGREWDLSFVARCLIAGHALCFYAWQLFWPTKLAFIYPRWQIDLWSIVQWIYPILFLGVLAASWIYRKKIGRGTFVAIAFYAVTLFPALGFVNVYPMRYSFVADHFQYIAGIGLIVWFVAGMEHWAKYVEKQQEIQPLPPFQNWLWHVLSVDIAFLLPLMLLTYTQCLAYQTKLTLWNDTRLKNPDSWMVHVNLGHVYVQQGDGRSAMEEYQLAEKLAPHVPEPHYNVGYRLEVNHDYPGALAEFGKAIELDPNFALAYYGRGNVLRETGKLGEAVEQYKKAVAADPGYADAWYNLGVTQEQRHNLDAAKDAYIHALAAQPNFSDARVNLAAVFIHQGNMDAAIEQYETAILIDPKDVRCTVTLLRLLARLNRPQEFNNVLAEGSKHIPDLKEILAHSRTGL